MTGNGYQGKGLRALFLCPIPFSVSRKAEGRPDLLAGASIAVRRRHPAQRFKNGRRHDFLNSPGPSVLCLPLQNEERT